MQLRFNIDDQVNSVIVIPAYNELESLPNLIYKLKKHFSINDAILIVDDSSFEIYEKTELECRKVLTDQKSKLYFIHNSVKNGRGNAVRRGISAAIKTFPNLIYIIECDADSSHRPYDIMLIKKYDSEADLLIGSRYLPGSKIFGWPKTRLIFSKVINVIVPKLLNLPISDITNGLRRYSLRAGNVLLAHPQQHEGFIYLTEQALHIKNAGLSIEEVPIEFYNRTSGKSTITFSEVIKSLFGILFLIFNNRIIKKKNIL